ncbi:MAG: ATP-binding protein, partial [Kiritimatiellae bacterium]|nr:ATP-binding protein [Kiritimatiellia bacterium]
IAAISRGRANVNVKFPGDVVLADPNALRHIGANLVSNAVKYSDGPIDIEVEGAHIRYKDRGPGIPGEAQKHIFERFYRVDNSITQKAGGIGIGLPIARLLARGMGGDVTYSCREGGGSVFTVSLKPFQQDCQKCRAFF